MAGSYIDGEDLIVVFDKKPETKKPETWREFIKKIEPFPQRQDSVQEQLRDLYFVANRLGFYDAADFIKAYI